MDKEIFISVSLPFQETAAPYSSLLDYITTILITLPMMSILITLNTGDINYNDITCNITRCTIKYMFFLIYALSKAIYLFVKSVIGKLDNNKVFISIVVHSF